MLSKTSARRNTVSLPMLFSPTAHYWMIALLLLSVALLTTLSNSPKVSARVSHWPVEVGTRCQQEYQNSWQVDVGSNDVWNRCSNFNNQIKQTDNLEFYYNLHGAKPMWEKTS